MPGTKGAAISRSDWLYWFCKAGRGWGKTKVGAETVRAWAENPKERILMIAPTASDVRDVMIEGPSGLMSCYPPTARPLYEPSRHLVTFPSGAIGITRSADEPERLRGPQFRKFWADEIGAWRFLQDAWDQIAFGFRLPGSLRAVITSTPKPLNVIRKLVVNSRTVVTTGSSYENRLNLSETYYQDVIRPYEGTRLGRQEINAEILEDLPGALWKRSIIDSLRITPESIQWPMVVRIVIAIDPAVTAKEGSDYTGIVVVGLTASGHVLVLDDLSVRETPAVWARIAVNAYRTRRADRIVGEVNNGGDLVESNIRTIDANVAFTAVHATRGKYVRAEPVAALYEQGRVHHAGVFEQLENQLCGFVPGDKREDSPDRMDALVWGITELLIAPQTYAWADDPYQISAI